MSLQVPLYDKNPHTPDLHTWAPMGTSDVALGESPSAPEKGRGSSCCWGWGGVLASPTCSPLRIHVVGGRQLCHCPSEQVRHSLAFKGVLRGESVPTIQKDRCLICLVCLPRDVGNEGVEPTCLKPHCTCWRDLSRRLPGSNCILSWTWEFMGAHVCLERPTFFRILQRDSLSYTHIHNDS